MRINSIVKESEANGPGKRGVVWVQGCSRHCEGCFNLETQSHSGGKEMDIQTILAEFDLDKIEGLTVSGGEPFEQPEELKELLKAAKQKNLNTLVYTGYKYNKILCNHRDILLLCNYLIDGEYDKNIPSKCRWAGSGNQRFLQLENAEIVQDLTECEQYSQTAEITIDDSGNVTVTGFINEI